MQPIHEYGGNKYFFRMYDKDGDRPSVAKRLGNTQSGDGVSFHGRGYVQLTGRRNYHAMSTVVGDDLVADPDKALRADYAAKIMFVGMRDGIFTSRRFADYFSKAADGSVLKDNWLGARAIINGIDQKDAIAQYARRYYASIGYTN